MVAIWFGDDSSLNSSETDSGGFKLQRNAVDGHWGFMQPPALEDEKEQSEGAGQQLRSQLKSSPLKTSQQL